MSEYEPSPETRRKLRGHAAYTLVRELAAARQSPAQLAKKYGVEVEAILYFKELNDEPIAMILADAAKDHALVGLWIAEKAKRLAEYQRDVDGINELENLEAPLLRVKQNAMKSVAEELGQLTQKVEVDNTVRYSIDGVDMDKLT